MENQELYIRLIHKFFEKEISDEESDQLNIWLNESVENKKTFMELKKLWYNSHSPSFDTDQAWENTLQRIRSNQKSRVPKTILLPKRNLHIWKAAVITLLISSLSLLYYLTDFNQIFNNQTPLYAIEAPKGEKTLLTLTDGTRVWLNSGSILQYSSAFNSKNRMVILNGEGYFEVTKDPENPFKVVCNETEVQVYGTRFNISNYQNDKFIQLTLVSGALSFFSEKTLQTTELHPSEQLTYCRENGKISLQETDTELYTVWKDNKLKLDNSPFIDVIKKMERWYDVNIVLEPSMQGSESYTMTVKTESLREILEMLKLTTPFEYRIDQDTVYIFNKKAY